MQILSVQSLEADPYQNTLFDDPIQVSSYYIKNAEKVLFEDLKNINTYDKLREMNDNIYLGSLKLKMETISFEDYLHILNNYLNGFYKEEYIHDFYSLKKGNDKGIRWHEILGDSFVQNKFLVTELWYSDSIHKEIIGYFVMDSFHPQKGCFKKIEDLDKLNECNLELNEEQKLRYMLMSKKIGKEEFQKRYDVSIEQLKSWEREPIYNYLEYIKENG